MNRSSVSTPVIQSTDPVENAVNRWNRVKSLENQLEAEQLKLHDAVCKIPANRMQEYVSKTAEPELKLKDELMAIIFSRVPRKTPETMSNILKEDAVRFDNKLVGAVFSELREKEIIQREWDGDIPCYRQGPNFTKPEMTSTFP